MKIPKFPSHMPSKFPFIDRKMWEKKAEDRKSHRAAVDAGYASLAEYVQKWGEEKMDYRAIARAITDPENQPHQWNNQDLAKFFISAADDIEALNNRIETLQEVVRDQHNFSLKLFEDNGRLREDLNLQKKAVSDG